jgi:hypothetical protein
MSRFERIGSKLRTEELQEKRDILRLLALYQDHSKHYILLLPSPGETARKEHLQEPFEVLYDTDVASGQKVTDLTLQTEAQLQAVYRQGQYLGAQLGKLRREVNAIALNRNTVQEGMYVIDDTFAPGITLPTLEQISRRENIKSVTFISTDNITPAPSGYAESPLIVFGKPLEGITQNPVEAIKSETPFFIQSIVRKADDSQTKNYLSRNFEAVNGLVRTGSVPFHWYQITGSDPALNGYIIVQLNQPYYMSYLSVNLSPQEALDSVGVIDVYGNEERLPGNTTVYFTPRQVQSLRIYIKHNMPAEPLNYQIGAYIVRLSGSDGENRQVFYKDSHMQRYLAGNNNL